MFFLLFWYVVPRNHENFQKKVETNVHHSPATPRKNAELAILILTKEILEGERTKDGGVRHEREALS